MNTIQPLYLLEAGWILFFLILFFGVIALLAIVLRNMIPGFKDKKGPVDEEVAVQQELERVLEPITDEKVLAQLEEANKNEPHDD